MIDDRRTDAPCVRMGRRRDLGRTGVPCGCHGKIGSPEKVRTFSIGGLSPDATPDRSGGKALRACPFDLLYTGSRPVLLIDEEYTYTFFRPGVVIEIVT